MSSFFFRYPVYRAPRLARRSLAPLRPFAVRQVRRQPEVAYNIAEDNSAYTIEASVPGYSPENLEVTLEGQVLTIKGERAETELPEDARYHIREQVSGKFSRSVKFTQALNGEGIEANYKDGVLTVRVPKAEEVKPRQINVQTQPALTEEQPVSA